MVNVAKLVIEVPLRQGSLVRCRSSVCSSSPSDDSYACVEHRSNACYGIQTLIGYTDKCLYHRGTLDSRHRFFQSLLLLLHPRRAILLGHVFRVMFIIRGMAEVMRRAKGRMRVEMLTIWLRPSRRSQIETVLSELPTQQL